MGADHFVLPRLEASQFWHLAGLSLFKLIFSWPSLYGAGKQVEFYLMSVPCAVFDNYATVLTIPHVFKLVHHLYRLVKMCIKLGIHLVLFSPVACHLLCIFFLQLHMTLKLQLTIFSSFVMHIAPLNCRTVSIVTFGFQITFRWTCTQRHLHVLMAYNGHLLFVTKISNETDFMYA